MRLIDCFIEQCRSQPDTIALRILSSNDSSGPSSCRSRDLTWCELERLLHRTIELLLNETLAVKTGDHVATWLPNGLAWILVDLATQWLGCVHVALDTRLPAKMAGELVRHSRSKLLVVERNELAEMAEQLPDCSILAADKITAEEFELDWPVSHREDGQRLSNSALLSEHAPAQLLYTSGTIGQPKGALLSHGNLLSNAQAKLQAAPQWPSDVRLNILPFAHAYARTCELSTWILSGSTLCVVRDWNAFLYWAPVIKPTLINLVPQLVYRLMDKLNELSAVQPLGNRLRLLQVGGAALRKDVWDRLATMGWPPLQGYGLTETSPVICSNRTGHQRHDCVGPPVAGVEVRIDSEGVLWTRGPHVMLGYWQNPSATQAKMRDDWFCTGDLAEQLSDGTLRIFGRTDDQITLSTGYKVAALELTRRLSDDAELEHVVIVGQDRPSIAALIFPRLDHTWDPVALSSSVMKRWHVLTRDLPRSMQIQRVAVIKYPLTVDNGGLNFKGAVRRAFVEQTLCRREVEQMYR